MHPVCAKVAAFAALQLCNNSAEKANLRKIYFATNADAKKQVLPTITLHTAG